MSFLLAATRSAASHNKVRQFLILLFRVLCVLMLVVFLARPLTGGWLGWALQPAPDAILILLDRSASMETRAGDSTRREQAIKLLSEAAVPFEQTSHLVLIDSATRQPQDFARASDLARLSATQPADTAADIPALLRAAFAWLVDNKAGSAEIWIASDSQRSNWLPDDPRWKNLSAQIASLSQRVRIRYLAMDQPAGANTSVCLKELVRRRTGGQGELQVLLDVERNRASSAPVSIEMNLDGVKSQMETPMEGQALRWRQRIALGARSQGGWGVFQLPSDANAHDNAAYFVYGSDIDTHAACVSPNGSAARRLQYTAASRSKQPAQLFSAQDFVAAKLDELSLVIWQDALPSGPSAERLRAFADEGGVVIFYPPGRQDSQQYNGVNWGDVQNAPEEKPFRVERWDEDQGPLARSDERVSLPLPQTTFTRRQQLAGPKTVLAAFDDGSAFLARQVVGKGEIYFCATLPDDEWSSLGEGPVLVPMTQRLLQTGARRLQSVSSTPCGELGAADQARQWESVDSPGKNIRFQSGIYRSGERLMAVNRPTQEDEIETMDMDDARKLFGGLSFSAFNERSASGPLQGEIWRIFLFAMLVFLIVEAILIMPSKTPANPMGRSVQ